MRKTKILCTMGPSCESPEVLKRLIAAGMNAVRLNMAHGELADHAARIASVRQAASEAGAIIPILMDIKGPEIRIGKLREASVVLKPGEILTLTTEDILGDANRVPVNYADMPSVIKSGDRVLLDDGLIELKVVSVEGTEMRCEILNGGTLKPRKGVNLPGIRTTLPGVTERDVQHIMFGIEQRVDIIAMSFVRKGADVLEVRRILEENGAAHVQIISKIENEEGVSNLDEIIEASDGIMVARGDLGVEIPLEDVPMVQREMIEKCNLAGKPVIVATHMLESMQVNPRPTRAEVSDVTNAVLQGADVIMLSGETAAGKYPVESVATMAQIAAKAETMFDHASHYAKQAAVHTTNITEVMSQAVVRSSLELNAKAIVTPTVSGFTARMVSKYRPQAPILAITQQDEALAKLSLYRGVFPVRGEQASSSDEIFEMAVRYGREAGLLAEGDYVVISAGVPIGKTGATNLMKIQQV
ncbi:pyruvate kinase [Paenibacillus thermoaerophilus]|uniref:Pyruvate kinase n=1 Tax=Paenibacillus thermoaerophilus TaxID=1215385 RepID=A0ABW2V2N3_9BACL|nr:pyruvate kinase [Paenibacillus thermoaerophilus]TMV18185.1 pyruvate kinase [Paenibacillus thermoaerophilus]